MFKNILEFLGILLFVTIIYRIYKYIEDNTKTTIVSDDALKAIQDPEKAEKLRDVIDEYHDTGKWDREKLESIL